jgi:hypothetical protein
MFRMRVKKRRSALAPLAERPVLSTVAGLAAIGAIGFGYWWNRHRRY